MTGTTLLLAVLALTALLLRLRRTRPRKGPAIPDNAAPSLARATLHFELQINRAPVGGNQALSFDVLAV